MRLRISDIYRDLVDGVEVVEVWKLRIINIYRDPVEVLEVENIKYL